MTNLLAKTIGSFGKIMRRFPLYLALLLVLLLIPFIGQTVSLADKTTVQKLYIRADEQFEKHN